MTLFTRIYLLKCRKYSIGDDLVALALDVADDQADGQPAEAHDLGHAVEGEPHITEDEHAAEGADHIIEQGLAAAHLFTTPEEIVHGEVQQDEGFYFTITCFLLLTELP